MAGFLATEMCRWLDMVEELDRTHAWSGWGVKSCAHWLSWACSLSPGTAREHVRVARLLPLLPLIRKAFAAGELSFSKVREASRLAGRIDEAALLNIARVSTASQLERTVRGFRRADTDRLSQEQTRKVRWRTDEDGSFILTARLPAEEGAVLLAALETATGRLTVDTRSSETASSSDGRAARAGQGCGSEQPPVDRADALLAVAHQYLNSEPTDDTGQDRHLVVVHVDPDVLAGGVPAGTPACEIAGVGGITACTAARLACDATVVAAIRDSSGAVLNFGRKRRLVSPAQRQALAIRDGCCQYPSCARSQALEAHHVQHWAAGGRTDLDNLILLCRFHHLAIHEDIAAITASRGGKRPLFTFTCPDGSPLPDDPTERHRTLRSVHEHEQLQIQRRLDAIKDRDWSWTDQETERIRPLWRGESFDLGYIVATLFTRLIPNAA